MINLAQYPYNYHTLSNGIRLVHRYTPSQVAHLGVFIDVGSRDERKSENGMAHFIEHCIFKGTEKLSSNRILSRIDGVGGELNAYTTKEETVVYATFLNNYYQRAIKLLSDIILNSTFPDKELEKEKTVIIEEINSYEDSPADLIYDEFENLVFGDTGLGRMILGTPENVMRFSSNDVKDFISNSWSAKNIVISTVGNIEFDRWARMCEKFFSPYPNRQTTVRKHKKYNYKPQFIRQNRDTFQTHIIIGNQAYDYKNNKRVAFTLLNNILGSPAMNSALNMYIREKHGLVYTIESSFVPYSDNGIFQIYAGTEAKNIDKIISLIHKTLERFTEKRLTQNQIFRAKEQLKGQLAIQYDYNKEEMLSIGKSLLNYGKVETLQETFNEIDSITPKDILTVAGETFCISNLSTIIYE